MVGTGSERDGRIPGRAAGGAAPAPAARRLVLFDIDGTLLRTRDVGRQALEAALARIVGAPLSTKGVRFSGKTDPQILHEIMVCNGCDAAQLDGRFDDVVAAYAEAMRAWLTPEHVEVMPGVPALLQALHQEPGVYLGLLTGNVEPMAYLKLEMAGLDAFFPFGAFGSDDADRYALPAVALARARRHTGHPFDGTDVIIVGDTEHDIGCGRGIGARSIGVCTGRYTRAELARHAPDVLLEDLTDVAAFRAHVLAPSRR